jgi:hypothetical protein
MATQPDSQQQEAQLRISNRISGFFLGLIGVLSLLAAVVYVGEGATTSMPQGSMPQHTVAAGARPAAQTLTVAMHDPGCHWFQVGRSYKKSLALSGPVNLRNSDEAALKVAGSNGVQNDRVGQQLYLAPGSYRITMVGQAPDDNTLHLTVS